MLDCRCCGGTPKHIDLTASDTCNIKSSEEATKSFDQEKIEGSRGSNREKYKLGTFPEGAASISCDRDLNLKLLQLLV